MDSREQTRYICAETIERYMGQEVQIVRQTMLEQESTFKEQLRELHRLYDVQKLLMSEMKGGGLIAPPSANKDRSLQLMTSCTQVGFGAGGHVKDFSNGLSFEGLSSKLKPGYLKELQDGGQQNRNPRASLDIFEKTTSLLRDGSSKTTKRTFDLEKPPEENMDDELNEENNLRETRGDEAKRENYKHGNGYSQPDSRIFLSLNTISKEENNRMACVSTSLNGRNNLEEHPTALKPSRFTGERYLPSSDMSDSHAKPTLSSHQNFLGALSLINLEKSSDQESLSSWNADDACSDGSRKKGRMSLSFDVGNTTQDARKSQREYQGMLKPQAVFLNGGVSGPPNFMEEVQKNKAACPPEIHGSVYLEKKLAGQPRLKSCDANKEADRQSSGGMYGYLSTTVSSNSGGLSQPVSVCSKAVSYEVHPSANLETTRQPVCFSTWGESQPATSLLSAGFGNQGQGSMVRTGVSSDSTRRNGQSNDSRLVATGEQSLPQEGMTGLWFQPRPDLMLFSHLQQLQALTGLQTVPVSSQTQVSRNIPIRGASDGTYPSPNGKLPFPKNSSPLECQQDCVQKPTDDFSSVSWATPNEKGSRFRTFGTVISQKPSLNKPPKLVLDGDAMELKLASSEAVQVEKAIQSKVPGGSSRGEHLQPLPTEEDVHDSSSNSPDQATGSSRELGISEALKSAEVISRDFYCRLPEELGDKTTQPGSYSLIHVSNVSSRAIESEITDEFPSDSKLSSCHMSKSGLELVLRPGSLQNHNGDNVVTDPPACSTEALKLNKADCTKQGANNFVKASANDDRAGLSLNLEAEKHQDILVGVEPEKPNSNASMVNMQVVDAIVNRTSDEKKCSSRCEMALIERDTKSERHSIDEIIDDTNNFSDFSKSSVTPSIEQNDEKAEKALKSKSYESWHNEPIINFMTNLRKTTSREDKGAELPQICLLKTVSEKQSICSDENQNLKIIEKLRHVHAETPESSDKRQACHRPEKSLSLDEQDVNAPPLTGPELEPLKSLESVNVATPGEDIVASFESTVTNVEETSDPVNVEPYVSNGVSTQNFGSGRITTSDPRTKTGVTDSKSGCIDSLILNHSSKPSEISEDCKVLPKLIECSGTTAVVSHCSTLASAATPGQQSSEASSHINARTMNATRKVPDGKLCTNPKAGFESQNTSIAVMPTTQDTSEAGHSLCLDESANLAASILVSLLPIVSLPSNNFEKERGSSYAQNSSSSSADRLEQLGDIPGKSAGSSSVQKSGPSPSLKLRYDPLRSTIHIACSEKVYTTERVKKDYSQRLLANSHATSVDVKGCENVLHEEPGSSNEEKPQPQKRRESAQRPYPECDLTSLNTQGAENVIHRRHKTGSQENLSSQKNAGAETPKTKKFSKKCHESKCLPGVPCLETPGSKSGQSLDMDVCHNKHLAQDTSLAGCACYTIFEGEGSNQVVGQPAAKPNSLDNSEDEDMWGPSLQTKSQQLDSQVKKSKSPSGDPVVCIRSWGESTRKRRMQRHRNPAFHKRQKSHKISLSKLQS